MGSSVGDIGAPARAARESGMKLLRTIRLDPSDTFVFDRAAILENGRYRAPSCLRTPIPIRLTANRVLLSRRVPRRGVVGLVDAGPDRSGKRR